MTGRKRVRRIVFKTCIGCPFTSWGRCSLVKVREAGFLVGRPLPGNVNNNRSRPPEWCPLRRRDVVVSLEVDG